MHLAQLHHIGICIFKHLEFYWKLNENNVQISDHSPQVSQGRSGRELKPANR